MTFPDTVVGKLAHTKTNLIDGHGHIVYRIAKYPAIINDGLSEICDLVLLLDCC